MEVAATGEATEIAHLLALGANRALSDTVSGHILYRSQNYSSLVCILNM